MSGTRAAASTSEDLRLEVQQLQGEAFRIETNLCDLLAIDKRAEHSILEEAVFAIYDMNYRIEEMRTYSALSGALGDEVVHFGQKLGFIAKELDPGAQEQRFGRVLEIRGFPPVSLPHVNIDADALLKVRAAGECVEFRSWLQSLDNATDDEISARVASLDARVSTAFQSTTGKTVRFFLTAALGLLPGGAGIVSGTAASVLDAFVLDRLLSAPGPALFLNRLYPSILRRRS